MSKRLLLGGLVFSLVLLGCGGRDSARQEEQVDLAVQLEQQAGRMAVQQGLVAEQQTDRILARLDFLAQQAVDSKEYPGCAEQPFLYLAVGEDGKLLAGPPMGINILVCGMAGPNYAAIVAGLRDEIKAWRQCVEEKLCLEWMKAWWAIQ